jgi:Flp pilus assembly protein TadB
VPARSPGLSPSIVATTRVPTSRSPARAEAAGMAYPVTGALAGAVFVLVVLLVAFALVLKVAFALAGVGLLAIVAFAALAWYVLGSGRARAPRT